MEASRRPPELVSGSLVFLKLLFGAAVSITHTLPFCLAIVPEVFDLSAVPDGGPGLVDFKPYFGKSDIHCIWTQRILAIRSPLRTIMVSGLVFKGERKLKAASIKKIRAIVSAYELGE